MLDRNPQYDGNRRWGLWGVEPTGTGFSALIKETPEICFAHSALEDTLRRHQEAGSHQTQNLPAP